jgi:hypothetical protein
MNPAALVGRALTAALGVSVSPLTGAQLGVRARLAVAEADAALEKFSAKQRQAIARALNEAMRNAFAATVADTLREAHIKRRKALTEANGQRGRLRWYRASPKTLQARLWIGLKTEPGLTLVRTGNAGARPSCATIAAANRRGSGRAGSKAAARAAALGNLPGLRVGKGGAPRSPLFWACMPNGHTGVFARRGRGRLPIDEPYLPIQDAARRAGTRHVERHFRDTYPRALKRLMGI